ncbi:hypothetical protein P4H65_11560 [Paenibacillus chitinolyticus]|uniref:hypothetical protein n=1 Tax=Paenibacillus chitinolyticus TaxID=79263 RepID=UPI002DB6220B|nr:hypothetical protein [Paenibacillus chitinolyticus]MEC0246424.1 hypothetical protein [Paenibacillus chitinolyticus]
MTSVPTVTGISRLIKGNTVPYIQIPNGDEQSHLIQSKHSGPVVAYAFHSTNPTAKKIFVNSVIHDINGRDITVSIFNDSGGPIDAEVVGWEMPLT